MQKSCGRRRRGSKSTEERETEGNRRTKLVCAKVKSKRKKPLKSDFLPIKH